MRNRGLKPRCPFHLDNFSGQNRTTFRKPSGLSAVVLFVSPTFTYDSDPSCPYPQTTIFVVPLVLLTKRFPRCFCQRVSPISQDRHHWRARLAETTGLLHFPFQWSAGFRPRNATAPDAEKATHSQDYRRSKSPWRQLTRDSRHYGMGTPSASRIGAQERQEQASLLAVSGEPNPRPPGHGIP